MTGSPASQPPAAPGHHLAGTASIAVTMSYRASLSGDMYTEGAKAEILLRDADGSVVATRRTDPGGRVTFSGLPPGRYRLEPALRPCDGNCGYLDPRTDGCRTALDLHGAVQVRVDFQVGSACRIST